MNALPDDAIECIASYLSFYDLLLLYFAGERQFNYRLCKNVRTFKVASNHSSPMGALLSFPPHCTAQFTSLLHVSVRLHKEFAALSAESLKNLPSCLLSLELVFKGALEALFLRENPRSDAVVTAEPISVSRSSQVLELGRLFPRLEKLVVADTGKDFTIARWKLDSISTLLRGLPPSIQTLLLHPLEELFKQQMLPLFPRSLLRLSTSIKVRAFDLQQAIDYSLIPSESTNLRVLLDGVIAPTFSAWPKNMTKLHLRLSEVIIEEDYFQGLPGTITELRIVPMRSSGRIQHLPQSLLRLSIDSSYSRVDVPLMNLPRSLKKLVLRVPASNLQEEDSDDPEYALEGLPSSLQKLTLDFGSDWPLTGFSKLVNLKSLKISTKSITDEGILDTRGLQFLPRGLSHLSLATAHLLTADAIKQLPSTLTSFKLEQMRIDAGVNWANNLPRTLRSLELRLWSKPYVFQWATPSNEPDSPVQLPLTTLVVRPTEPELIGTFSFQTVPKTLTEVEVARFSLSLPELAAMPSTLIRLNLSSDTYAMNT